MALEDDGYLYLVIAAMAAFAAILLWASLTDHDSAVPPGPE